MSIVQPLSTVISSTDWLAAGSKMRKTYDVRVGITDMSTQQLWGTFKAKLLEN